MNLRKLVVLNNSAIIITGKGSFNRQELLLHVRRGRIRMRKLPSPFTSSAGGRRHMQRLQEKASSQSQNELGRFCSDGRRDHF